MSGAYFVACPYCHAAGGTSCRAIGGQVLAVPHIERTRQFDRELGGRLP